jgi:hypothetical protein
MGLEKFPHSQPDMGIPAVSYCYHGDGSRESIPDGDLPIAILTFKACLVAGHGLPHLRLGVCHTCGCGKVRPFGSLVRCGKNYMAIVWMTAKIT